MKQASISAFFGAPKVGAAVPKPVPPPPPPPPPRPAASVASGATSAAPAAVATLPNGAEWLVAPPPPPVASAAAPSAEPAETLLPPAKKAKKAAAAPGALTAASFRTLRAVPLPEAAYVDECMTWATLRDGRELLIGAEVWHVPASFPASPAVKLAMVDPAVPAEQRECWEPVVRADDAESYGKFAALAGQDAIVQAVSPYYPRKAAGGGTSMVLRALPDLAELARVQLPLEAASEGNKSGYYNLYDERHVSKVVTAPGGLVLVLTPRWLFYLRASDGVSEGAPPSLQLLMRADLEAAVTPLGRELHRGPPEKHWSGEMRKKTLVNAVALLLPTRGEGAGVPQALLANGGRVLRVPLAPSDDAAGGGPLQVAAVYCGVHSPMMKSDKDAYIMGLALWHRGGGASALVSTGSDGDCVVTPLHDGDAFVQPGAWHHPGQERWHATRIGSGGSKGYPYSPSGLIAVHSGAGVAVAGSYSDPELRVFDLASEKTSQAGKTLAVAKKLAGGRKVTIFLASIADRSGRIATSNSNDRDDTTLVILCPAAK